MSWDNVNHLLQVLIVCCCVFALITGISHGQRS